MADRMTRRKQQKRAKIRSAKARKVKSPSSINTSRPKRVSKIQKSDYGDRVQKLPIAPGSERRRNASKLTPPGKRASSRPGQRTKRLPRRKK